MKRFGIAMIACLTACGIGPAKVQRSAANSTAVPTDQSGDQNGTTTPPPATDSFAYGLTSEEAFKVSVYTLTSVHCSNCHRPNAPSIAVQPYFASLDPAEAHKATIDSKKADLAAPENSRLYARLKKDMHQCWSGDCNADAAAMLKLLNEWVEHMKTKEDNSNKPNAGLYQTGDLLASQAEQRSAADPQTILIEAESGTLTAPMAATTDATASGGRYLQVPNNGQNLTLAANAAGAGIVTYNFNITVPGTYQIFGLASAPVNTDQSFFIGVDATALVPWILPLTTTFAWSVANNNTATLSFPLTAGAHTLTLRQRQDGTKIDRIAVSTAAVYTGPPKSGFLKVLRYDLSAMAKKPGVFLEIEIEDFDQGTLKFRNPKVISASQPVHVQGLHLILNGQDDQRNATYFMVDKQVQPPSAILSTSSMIVLPDIGGGQDKIGFRFDLVE